MFHHLVKFLGKTKSSSFTFCISGSQISCYTGFPTFFPVLEGYKFDTKPLSPNNIMAEICHSLGFIHHLADPLKLLYLTSIFHNVVLFGFWIKTILQWKILPVTWIKQYFRIRIGTFLAKILCIEACVQNCDHDEPNTKIQQSNNDVLTLSDRSFHNNFTYSYPSIGEEV